MKLSIVLSTYNGEAYITEQLDSILNQTRKADEVLIFDDCSTDNTPQIIEQFISGHNLTTWKFAVNHENKGWKRNFMEGIWSTSGDLVFPCDQDDIWMPQKLEQMEKIMAENPQIMVLTSNYESFYDSGKRVCGPEKDDGKLIKQPLSNKVFNIRYPGCTYCIRREFVEISKKHWQVDFPHDALFWRMGMFSDTLYSYNESLIHWRKHQDSTFTKESNRNRTFSKKKESLDYAMRVVNDLEDFVNNCKVISCGSSVESLRKMQSVLPESEKLKYFPFNLMNTKEYSQKIQSAVEIFGKIDILILSAGVHSEKFNYYDMTEEEYERIMQINLKAPFFLCQSFANYLINAKRTGHICLVSSSRGAEPAYTPYGISKWALNGLTKGIAQELIKYGIVVNAVAPGSTATPLIGITSKDSIATDENSCGRLVHPNEVANIVKLLVSDTGNMIVGETVHISGGRGIFDIR